MHTVEGCIGGINGVNTWFALAMQLGGLAWDAAPRPLANILLQAIPSNPFHDKWNGGVGAWMN